MEKYLDLTGFRGVTEENTSPQSCCESIDMTFFLNDYGKEVMKTMNTMRSQEILTDVTIKVGSEQYPAHRVILATASPYFKAMFTGGLKESKMSIVRLKGVSSPAVRNIIEYFYTGEVTITENIVCQLLPAATMFQVPTVVQACSEFLERQLEPGNAIGISHFAEYHACMKLSKKANQYIEREFMKVCQEEEFLKLTYKQLIRLIRKDELNVHEEKDVYKAVLRWVKHDEENRSLKMEDILSAVRCPLLPPRFLQDQISTCDVIKKSPACQEYLSRIFQNLTLRVQVDVKERTPNMPKVIYVAGGYNKRSLDTLEGFNTDYKIWKKLDNLIVPRSGLGCVFMKGHLYAVGGRNNSPSHNFDSNWVDRYNPVQDKWMPCHPMSCPRYRVGVAVMDGLLYAVGGGECTRYHKSVECYDPETDRWTLVKPMNFARMGPAVAVVNRLLYAIGGYDGKVRHCHGECYHPENNEWTMIPAMFMERSGAGVCSIGKYIYVIGGFNGSVMNTVERYDTENKIWEFRSHMNCCRTALSVSVLDNKIYAMGGYDGQYFLDSVEIYDPDTDKWFEGVPLTTGRSGHASVVCYNSGDPTPGSRILDLFDSLSRTLSFSTSSLVR